MAAPTVGTSSTATGAASSFSIAYPAVSANSFLVVNIVANGSGTITIPAGWSRMPRCGGAVGRAPTAGHTWAFYKICDGTETGNAVFVNDAVRNYVMSITRYDGVSPYLPFSFVRAQLLTDDGTTPQLMSRFADGLGVCMIAYESAADQTGATFSTGGAASANWNASVYAKGQADSSTNYGVLTFSNSGNFATVTVGAGSAGWNTIGQTDYRMCSFVLNSDATLNVAPVYNGNALIRASTWSGSAVTTLSAFSTDLDGGQAVQNCMMLPGAVIVLACLSNVEASAITNWKTVNSAKAVTAISGSPYAHSGASPAMALHVGYITLDESDCYHATTDDFTGTITSSTITYCAQLFYVEGPASRLVVTLGTFETIDANSTAPDPTAITTPRANSLVISMDASNNATAATADTSYVKGSESLNSSATFRLSFESKKVVAAGSEDPGAWTTGNAEHIMFSMTLSKAAIVNVASDFGWGINFGGLAPSEVTHPKGRLLMGVG